MHLMTQAKNNVSALELKRHLGVSYPTAWMLKHKIMEVMVVREDTRQLTGRVEIDDAYLGGERSGGKPGRGSENKVPFVAAVFLDDRGRPRLLKLNWVSAFTWGAMGKWAKASLAAGYAVVSDRLGCFAAVTTAGCTHQAVVAGDRKT